MNSKTTVAISAIAATTLLLVIAPTLISSAGAVAIPKTEERCDDPRFADRESCPGKSEEAEGGDRDDVCVARNAGQAKNCPPGSEVVLADR